LRVEQGDREADRTRLARARRPRTKTAGFARAPRLLVETVEALRARLLTGGQLMDAALVCALACAGLRPQEARRLRWSDLSSGAILVRGAGPGARAGLPRSDRSVRLLEPLAADLAQWRRSRNRAERGHVFGDPSLGRGAGWWSDWKADVYTRAAATCFPKPATPAELRWVFSNLMLRQGVPLATVAAEMGESLELLSELYGSDASARDERPGLAEAEIEAARSDASQALWSSSLVERFVDDGKVIRGKDGWLFLAYDRSRTLDQHAGRLRLSDKELEQWRKVLEDRSAWLRERNTPFLFLVAPNTHSVYPEQLPDGVPSLSEQRCVRQLLAHLEATRSPAEVLYPLDELMAARAVRPVCFSAGAHWNGWGAFVAYRILVERLRALGVPARAVSDNEISFVEEDMLGELAFKAGLGTRKQYVARLPTSARLVSDNCITNRGEQLVLECNDAPPVRCLVLGDSYARSLLRFMAETFGRVVFGWVPCLDRDLVERERPDVVIMVLTERWLIQAPDDSSDHSLEAWEARKRAGGEVRPRISSWGMDAGAPTEGPATSATV